MPPRQRSVRSARFSLRSTLRITSSRSVRSSSLRSRSVVVVAVQTSRRSEPRVLILCRSSFVKVRGRCCSRRRSSASADAQPCFPFFFQATSNQSVFRIYGFVLTLRSFRLVTGTFHFTTPLRECGIVMRFQLSGRECWGLHSRWGQRLEKGIGHRFIDGKTAHVE